MNKYIVFSVFLLLSFFNQSLLSQEKEEDWIKYVNPFIGTQSMGHTFPGATAPFGMVQLSPETNQVQMFNEKGDYNKKTYEYCAGYQYADSTIFGFTHTHMSGTGHADLGDFLIMPTTGELTLEPGTADHGIEGYHSAYRHATEKAKPGYYEVVLDDYNIKAQLTATERVGYHKYTFSRDEEAHIILDLMANVYNHDAKNVWSFVRVENDSTVVGYRQTNGWARTRYVYFAMEFSKPFKNYGHKKYNAPRYNGFYRKFDEEHNFPEMAGQDLRAYFDFDVTDGEAVEIKFALSGVSTNGAMKNLEAEIPNWDFDEVKNQTQKKWNKELSKIEVETINEAQKETFYTAMYHTMMSPVVYEDVDKQYRGLDQNIYTSEDFTNYTLFSLWDTYRALHPLFNIVHPQRNNDMIKSMLVHQEQSVHKMLPIWSHYSNENWCMVGYHSVTVLADAVVKNTTDADLREMLEAARATANVPYFDGVGEYVMRGYVPEDKSGASVSKTLEYSYNDWCIAQIANELGDDAAEKEYTDRSKNYKNVFDKESNYMRPRLSDGSWKENFDPLDTHGQGFIEGNAWNYGLYVPHQIDTMISMMGGKEAFSAHLDKIFTTEIEDKYIEHHEDITRDGIIGNYVHGNEPGHHIPYLYNWTNDPWKTQERVRMIMDTMYSNEINGLCGNDDAGQMSAWYIFSSLGFYPVLPGSPYYAIGSPLVKQATIHLEGGKKLQVIAKNQSSKNVYVKKVTLNGREIIGNQLDHNELVKGGVLEFEMSRKPSK